MLRRIGLSRSYKQPGCRLILIYMYYILLTHLYLSPQNLPLLRSFHTQDVVFHEELCQSLQLVRRRLYCHSIRVRWG